MQVSPLQQSFALRHGYLPPPLLQVHVLLTQKSLVQSEFLVQLPPTITAPAPPVVEAVVVVPVVPPDTAPAPPVVVAPVVPPDEVVDVPAVAPPIVPVAPAVVVPHAQTSASIPKRCMNSPTIGAHL